MRTGRGEQGTRGTGVSGGALCVTQNYYKVHYYYEYGTEYEYYSYS